MRSLYFLLLALMLACVVLNTTTAWAQNETDAPGVDVTEAPSPDDEPTEAPSPDDEPTEAPSEEEEPEPTTEAPSIEEEGEDTTEAPSIEEEGEDTTAPSNAAAENAPTTSPTVEVTAAPTLNSQAPLPPLAHLTAFLGLGLAVAILN